MSNLPDTLKAKLQAAVTNTPVLLFMKGDGDFPQCGFSAKAVQILNDLEIEFAYVNVLEDDEIREGIKEFSNWPTIPQLYVHGNFVGGSDIMTEMFENGELKELFNKSVT